MSQETVARPTPETRLADLIATRPSSRRILRSFGIDTCCGTALTVAEAAAIRDVRVEDVLRALAESGEESAARVAPHETLRALIAKHPQTVAVFERHGLMGCGGAAGPDERLDFFARVHGVDLATLTAELEDAIARPSEQPPPVPPPSSADDGATMLYRRFIAAALICTTTLGATFGAYNLFAFHTGIGPATPAHNWSHASFQVMGFVLLFIMGVSYHTLPRFLASELARPRLARATFWLALLGLIVRNYGNLAPLVPAPLVAIVAGTLLQALAVVGWAAVLFATARRARARREPFHDFLIAGTFFWILAAAIAVAGAVHAAVARDPNYAPRWNEPHYAAALFGGALLWIQGMFLRTGPSFLGLRPTREPLVETSIGLGVAGALALVLGGLIGSGAVAFALVDAGLLGTSLSIALFVRGVRVLERASDDAGDRAFRREMRTAFASGLLFAALASLFAIADLVGSRLPSLVFDGARHAFALGFVTLAIFGMAGRIVPVFTGEKLRRPRAKLAGVAFIAIGMLLRQSEVVVCLGGPNELLWVSGASGFVAAAGVLLASFSILATLRARSSDAPAAPVAIAPDANVAALVAAHPEALAVLVDAGFAPLRNPVLRRTVARAVTLEQACRMQGKPIEPLLARLREVCTHDRGTEAKA